MTNRVINIDFNPKSGRFVMSSPPWLVNVIRDLPNRRWDSNKQVWLAPAIRANAEVMKLPKFASIAVYTDSAKEAFDNASKPKVAKRDGSFPAWYKFKTEPWSHQTNALNKLYGLKSFALWADMRTGKSKITIDMATAYHMEGRLDIVVMVCPMSIRRNWEDELLNIHCPIPVSVHVLDSSKPKAFDNWLHDGEKFKWLIVAVESLAAGNAKMYVEKFLLTSTKAAMFVDESSKIKNHQANRSRECVRLGKMAEIKGTLTGTPIAKGPMDIYMQFEFMDPDILGMGDFYSFRNRYAVMGGYDNKEIIGYQNVEELMEIISPFVYQVRSDDAGIKLPPKTKTIRRVKMNPEQSRLYKSIQKLKMASDGDRMVTVQNALEKATRLQQIAGGSISYENPDATGQTDKYIVELIPGINPKIAEIESIADEIDGSMIIWCVYDTEISSVSAALRKKYGDDAVVEIHGKIEEDERHINVKHKFQGGHARFIVGNAATGGMGLTMSIADTVIYYSNSFNFIDREQSEERPRHASRSERPVLYIDLICEDTVDEIVMKSLSEKKSLSEYVRDSVGEIHVHLGLR